MLADNGDRKGKIDHIGIRLCIVHFKSSKALLVGWLTGEKAAKECIRAGDLQEREKGQLWA